MSQSLLHVQHCVIWNPTKIHHQSVHCKEKCVARRLDHHLISAQSYRERIFSIAPVLSRDCAISSTRNGLECVKHLQCVAHVRLHRNDQRQDV